MSFFFAPTHPTAKCWSALDCVQYIDKVVECPTGVLIELHGFPSGRERRTLNNGSAPSRPDKYSQLDDEGRTRRVGLHHRPQEALSVSPRHQLAFQSNCLIFETVQGCVLVQQCCVEKVADTRTTTSLSAQQKSDTRILVATTEYGRRSFLQCDSCRFLHNRATCSAVALRTGSLVSLCEQELFTRHYQTLAAVAVGTAHGHVAHRVFLWRRRFQGFRHKQRDRPLSLSEACCLVWQYTSTMENLWLYLRAEQH